MEIYTRYYGANHQEVGRSHNYLGKLYFSIKKFDDALKEFHATLKIYTTYYGPNHKVGRVYFEIGNV